MLRHWCERGGPWCKHSPNPFVVPRFIGAGQRKPMIDRMNAITTNGHLTGSTNADAMVTRSVSEGTGCDSVRLSLTLRVAISGWRARQDRVEIHLPVAASSPPR